MIMHNHELKNTLNFHLRVDRNPEKNRILRGLRAIARDRGTDVASLFWQWGRREIANAEARLECPSCKTAFSFSHTIGITSISCPRCGRVHLVEYWRALPPVALDEARGDLDEGHKRLSVINSEKARARRQQK
jgi:NMD protein affecting ribosome stability and mRNA decay